MEKSNVINHPGTSPILIELFVTRSLSATPQSLSVINLIITLLRERKRDRELERGVLTSCTYHHAAFGAFEDMGLLMAT